MKDPVTRQLPLRPAVAELLLSLASGPRHGYALKLDVESRSGDWLKLGPGTLYESIQRMEKRGLIEEVAPPAGADTDGRERRFYAITELGRDVLMADIARMRTTVRHARSLGLVPASG